MYSVLWAVSPELFPAKDRGTGNGLVFTATNLFGVLVRFHFPLYLAGSYFGHAVQAPVIALYANLNTAAPVYIAGALMIATGGLTLLLPFEPRGRASI